MARPLDVADLSMTGSGVALITNVGGDIVPTAAQGLIVADRRVMSRWQLTSEHVSFRRVGHRRLAASSDLVVLTVSEAGSIDPIGVLTRHRRLAANGLVEQLELTAHSRLACRLVLAAEADDEPVFELGDDAHPARPLTLATPDAAPATRLGSGLVVSIVASGWSATGDGAACEIALEPHQTWTSELRVIVAAADGQVDRATSTTDGALESPPTETLLTADGELGGAVKGALLDLAALSMTVDGRSVIAAGSPFFLALFGRDSLIAGMQSLITSSRPLVGTLAVLAGRQGRRDDAVTAEQPGRILHELRVGRAGVFGVPPGTAYFGAVDTSPLFVIALGEAARWGADRDAIRALVPAARAALDWCEHHGDVDGDGFIESLPHASGITNAGWKDSGDSVVDVDGRVLLGSTVISEVQAYWFRALRTMADLERWLDIGDGDELDRHADRLAARFANAFVYDAVGGPFVGLALDAGKRLLRVPNSNAGHALWTGILEASTAAAVARHLCGDDMFSGWGIRTLGASAAGYNPLGYHRGTVWPHDTAIAMLGAARHGLLAERSQIGAGLLDLAAACGCPLPELLSGLERDRFELPIAYPAACRPQAWAAGSILMAIRAWLGLEPDVTRGELRLLGDTGSELSLTVRDLRLGAHSVSIEVRAGELVDVSSTLSVITGRDAVLADSPWGVARGAG